jgi:hypothetical protein
MLDALIDLRVGLAGLGQARDVALHVGEKHRHADVREGLGQALQRDGLARAGAPAIRPWRLA